MLRIKRLECRARNVDCNGDVEVDETYKQKRRNVESRLFRTFNRATSIALARVGSNTLTGSRDPPVIKNERSTNRPSPSFNCSIPIYRKFLGFHHGIELEFVHTSAAHRSHRSRLRSDAISNRRAFDSSSKYPNLFGPLYIYARKSIWLEFIKIFKLRLFLLDDIFSLDLWPILLRKFCAKNIFFRMKKK